MAANNVCTVIQGLSGQRDDWSALLQQIEQHLPNIRSTDVDGILAQLTLPLHTIGFAYMLNIKTRGNGQMLDDAVFIVQCRQLLLQGDSEQLRYIRTKACELCRIFAECCRRSGQALHGIKALGEAIQKLRLSPESLTSVHADYLQLCLVAKIFKPAIPLLEQRILRITKDAMQARDYLLYFYYGGMVYAAVHRFGKALDMFQLAFTMPCQVLSEIMVEIHKKYILVSLIFNGEVPALPKYTSQILQRLLKNSSQEYLDFAQAIGSHSPAKVDAAMERHRETFIRDHNLGLAKQARDAVCSRNIQGLTQTYVTLSLSDIAQQVHLADAGAAKVKVMAMMERGEIGATIDAAMGMVSFNADLDRASSHALLERLEKQIQIANELNEKLRQVDETVSCSSSYLSKVTLQDRQSRWGEPADWPGVASGAMADEMLDVGEKPPGYSR